MTRVRRLPVTSPVPTQLVLGMPLGIERPRKRRRAKAPHPWLPAAAQAVKAA